MKKIIFGLALLIAISAAAFANSPADDNVSITWKDNLFTAPIQNIPGSGFDLVFSKIHDDTPGDMGYMFSGENVQNWLFDPNKDNMYLAFKNFDMIHWGDSLDNTDNIYLAVQVGSHDPQGTGITTSVMYYVPWSGSGVYTITPDDVYQMYYYNYKTREELDYISDPFNVDSMQISHSSPSGLVYLYLDRNHENSQFRYLDLPEPSTYAYGIMGLVSLMGLKRRIRK